MIADGRRGHPLWREPEGDGGRAGDAIGRWDSKAGIGGTQETSVASLTDDIVGAGRRRGRRICSRCAESTSVSGPEVVGDDSDPNTLDSPGVSSLSPESKNLMRSRWNAGSFGASPTKRSAQRFRVNRAGWES